MCRINWSMDSLLGHSCENVVMPQMAYNCSTMVETGSVPALPDFVVSMTELKPHVVCGWLHQCVEQLQVAPDLSAIFHMIVSDLMEALQLQGKQYFYETKANEYQSALDRTNVDETRRGLIQRMVYCRYTSRVYCQLRSRRLLYRATLMLAWLHPKYMALPQVLQQDVLVRKQLMETAMQTPDTLYRPCGLRPFGHVFTSFPDLRNRRLWLPIRVSQLPEELRVHLQLDPELLRKAAQTMPSAEKVALRGDFQNSNAAKTKFGLAGVDGANTYDDGCDDSTIVAPGASGRLVTFAAPVEGVALQILDLCKRGNTIQRGALAMFEQMPIVAHAISVQWRHEDPVRTSVLEALDIVARLQYVESDIVNLGKKRTRLPKSTPPQMNQSAEVAVAESFTLERLNGANRITRIVKIYCGSRKMPLMSRLLVFFMCLHMPRKLYAATSISPHVPAKAGLPKTMVTPGKLSSSPMMRPPQPITARKVCIAYVREMVLADNLTLC